MKRRDFIQLTLAGSVAALAPRTARAADARIDVLLDEPIGRITADLYGHFVEHLGGVVYDGIWVGEGSKIAEHAAASGRRSWTTCAACRRASIRWPGGCFADSYDWRDGIGPRDARPRRTNFWVDDMAKLPDGPWKYDPNHFGTNEFVRFCRLAGGEPYLAANLRGLPARDFYQWVEYCNSPGRQSTTLADQRAARRRRDPFNVSASGASATSRGAAAATSRPRSTPPSTAGSRRGCRATASIWRSSARDPTAATSTGRAASSRS